LSGKEHFVLLYPRISLDDEQAIRALAREVREVKTPGGGDVIVAGEPMVLADILDMVTRGAPLILVGAVLAVLLALVLSEQRHRKQLLRQAHAQEEAKRRPPAPPHPTDATSTSS
jgi:hypothetical protein